MQMQTVNEDLPIFARTRWKMCVQMQIFFLTAQHKFIFYTGVYHMENRSYIHFTTCYKNFKMYIFGGFN